MYEQRCERETFTNNKACCDIGCAVVQVLTALQRLVNVLGADSAACHPLLLPLLRYCTDITQARRATTPATHLLKTRSTQFSFACDQLLSGWHALSIGPLAGHMLNGFA